MSRNEGKFARPPVVTVAAEVNVDRFKSRCESGDWSSDVVELSSSYCDTGLEKL